MDLDAKTMFKLSYGLFVLSAKDGDKDNGCIINTVAQLSHEPLRLSMSVSKKSFTHDMTLKTKAFNVSILDESTPLDIFERFGFHSGKDTDKFAGCNDTKRTENGVRYLTEHVNGVISAKVTETIDCGAHTMFIADVTQAFVLSNEQSMTYQYYLDYVKPKPPLPEGNKKGFVCTICGYVYEGDVLPEDFICPLCKHGANNFEPINNNT